MAIQFVEKQSTKKFFPEVAPQGVFFGEFSGVYFTLGVIMTPHVFGSFAEASVFARDLAVRLRRTVEIQREEETWLVECPDEDAVTPDPSSRLCADCGDTIPAARLQVSPNASRCVKCQSKYERGHDTRRKVDEGPAGTRAEHKHMRKQLWGDMRNRGRGK